MNTPFNPYHKWLGIRPEEHPVDDYRLLGICRFESDPDVIANAADQRMNFIKTFNLGRHAEWAEYLLNQLAAVRVRLLDEQRKYQYDTELQARTAPNPPEPPPMVEECGVGPEEESLPVIDVDAVARCRVHRKRGVWHRLRSLFNAGAGGTLIRAGSA